MTSRLLSRLERGPDLQPAMLFRAFLLLCLACACLWPEAARAEPVLPALANAPATPLLPYLDYFLDENGDMDVEEAAAPDHAGQYRPLALRSLPNACGVMWLRFTIGALPGGAKAPTRLLDMGESIPGAPVLYEPVSNPALGTMEWREVRPSQRNLILLPEAGQAPISCYLRLDGLPGIWFSPTVRSPQDAADNWGGLSRLGAILALGVVMLLCILRAFSEKGQWRIWTALYVGVALAQALCGMPETGSGHVNMRQAAAIMLPGIALMLLPHVGRHLMGSSGRWRWLDIQLLLLSLPGAALALLPIIPSWLWLARWLDLWPAGTLIFVPTGLAAWISGTRGARRFLLGCLLPPVAVGVAIAGLDLGWAANLLASLPLWGVALSSLILATGGAVQAREDMDRAGVAQAAAQPVEAAAGDDIINLCEPLGQALRPTPASGEGVGKLPAPDSPGTAAGAGNAEEIFNLQKLLRRLHDEAARQAEARGIGLAWYMPPQLDQCYRGDGQALARTLEALLENALSATKCGSIHLSVRRVPESGDPGNLLFTVSDSGHGMEGRSAMALANACAMAGESGGYVGLECGPNGATIAFTTRLGCLDAWQGPSGEPLVIVLAETASMTRTLAHMLRDMPCRVRQAADFTEALEIQKSDPAILLIAEGAVASVSAGPDVRRFAELAHRAHLPLCKRLAITPDQSQWTALGKAGFTHALEEPVDDESLRATVAGILEKMRELQEEDARQASADHPARAEKDARPEGHADARETPPRKAGDPTEPDELARQETMDHGAGEARPAAGGGTDQDTPASAPAGLQRQENAVARQGSGDSPVSSYTSAVDGSPAADAESPFAPLPWPGETAPENAVGPAMPAETPLPLSGMDWPGDQALPAEPELSSEEEPAMDRAFLPGDGPAPRDTPPALAARACGGASARPGPDRLHAPAAVPAEEQSADMSGAANLSETGGRAGASLPAENQPSDQPEDTGDAPAGPTPDRNAFFQLSDTLLTGTTHDKMAGISAPDSGSGFVRPSGDSAAQEAGESGAKAAGGGDAFVTAEGKVPAGRAALPERQASFMDTALAMPQPVAPMQAQQAEGMALAQVSGSFAPASVPATATRDAPKPADPDVSEASSPAMPATAGQAAAAKSRAGQNQRQPAGIAYPSRAGAALRYISHHLGQPGEWVGEPMPIGTPISHEPGQPGFGEPAAMEKAASHGRADTEKKILPVRRQLAYESPSIRQPGEWVGEPMPVGTPIKGHDQAAGGPAPADAEPEGPARPDAANAPLETDQASNGSFLDFIAPPAQTEIQARRQSSDMPEKKEKAPIQALVTRLAETAMHVVARQERERTERVAGRRATPETAGRVQPQERSQNPPAQLRRESSRKAAPALPADPALAALVQGLDEAMSDAGRAFRAGNPGPVAQAASFIASRAEDFGFRVLARMARCVEQAARAGDMVAIGDLLPDLASAVERNRIALTPTRKEPRDSPD